MWQLLIPIGLVLGAGAYFVNKPFSIAFVKRMQHREYERHLTPAEAEAAQRGEVVEKVHKKYGDIWHSYYDQGALRVRWQNGRYQFTPHGTWVRLSKHGKLEAENIYTTAADSLPYEGLWKNYRADGSLDFAMYGLREVLNGDSVVHSVFVQFSQTAPVDTLAVLHQYIRLDGRTMHQFWSRDARGQQPMPMGWKPQ